MNEERHRLFHSPKGKLEEEKAIADAVPASTRYKNKWVVEVNAEWQSSRGQGSEEGVCLQDVITPLEYFDPSSFTYWLVKFVEEVVNKEG